MEFRYMDHLNERDAQFNKDQSMPVIFTPIERFFIYSLLNNKWLLNKINKIQSSFNIGIDGAFYMAIGRMEQKTGINFDLTEFNEDKETDFFNVILRTHPELEF